MFMMNSKWGIHLEGDPGDLQNIQMKLNGAITNADSPFVSKLNNLFVLRTARWDAALLPSEVQDLGREELAVIRGVIELLDGCGPLELATIFELADDGRIVSQVRITQIRIRSSKPQSEWVSASEYRNMALAVQSDKILRSALADLKYETSWYDIYRVVEALCRYYGGESKLKSAFPVDGADIARMKRTANSYRHTQGAFDPVTNPMSMAEAMELAAEILKQTVSSAAPSTFPPAFDKCGIPSYEYPAEQAVGLRILSADGPKP